MCDRRLLTAVVILVCGFWTLSSAVDLGASVGYDSYTISASVMGMGISVSGGGVCAAVNADFPIGTSPVLTSTSLGYGSGKFGSGEFGATLNDITVAEAIKVCLLAESAQVRPLFGAQLAYHFLGGDGSYSSEQYFGIGGFGGVAFRAGPKLSIPVQVSYDRIFVSQSDSEVSVGLGVIAGRVGVLFTL
jgi:hypothetical protein